MPASEQFTEAQLTQWLWKTEAMQRMAVALVELALRLPEFAADDLPADLDHGGQGIAGSICAKLADNGIITRCGVSQGTEFFPKVRASKAEGRKGSNINVWRVADRVKAAAFLRAKHPMNAEIADTKGMVSAIYKIQRARLESKSVPELLDIQHAADYLRKSREIDFTTRTAAEIINGVCYSILSFKQSTH